MAVATVTRPELEPTVSISADATEHIREFNRFYTRVIGALNDRILGSSYSLPEARVLFELRDGREHDVSELRRLVGIDAGYLTRILSRLEGDGLLLRSRSATDGRRRAAALTPAGRRTAKAMDRRSAAEIVELAGHLGELDEQRLVESLGVVAGVLGRPPEPSSVTVRAPRPGDYGWIVERHGVLQPTDYGWDQTFEALVAGIVADFGSGHDPAVERAWIAEVAGRRAGSIMCVRGTEAGTARLRLLLVEPFARGCGVGTTLVDACIDFARQAGYRRLELWTVSVLAAARRIYERAGFTLVDETPGQHWGQDLVAQTWALPLQP